MDDGPWMTSEAAADRLGVKTSTLYAYVSRGLIRSERRPGSRRSRFLRADVERVAGRGRAGRTTGQELVVETELTLIEPEGRLYYRGWDVGDAVESASFEEVAAWLWNGDRADIPFEASAPIATAARNAIVAFPDIPPIDRWRVALGAVRSTDALRDDRRAVAVAGTGRSLIAALVDGLEPIGVTPVTPGRLVDRLWSKLTSAPPSDGRLALLSTVLILMADHEMATSTLAARVAASTWADPYLVVQAALATFGGALHGGASSRTRQLLVDAGADGSTATSAVGERLAAGGRIPGFGHRVYRTVDPRAVIVLDRLTHLGDLPPAATAVLDICARQSIPFPNVDFALAAMAEAYGFAPGMLEITVATSRMVGWLAHAIEEYEHLLRFRTRAIYVGDRPT